MSEKGENRDRFKITDNITQTPLLDLVAFTYAPHCHSEPWSVVMHNVLVVGSSPTQQYPRQEEKL